MLKDLLGELGHYSVCGSEDQIPTLYWVHRCNSAGSSHLSGVIPLRQPMMYWRQCTRKYNSWYLRLGTQSLESLPYITGRSRPTLICLPNINNLWCSPFISIVDFLCTALYFSNVPTEGSRNWNPTLTLSTG